VTVRTQLASIEEKRNHSSAASVLQRLQESVLIRDIGSGFQVVASASVQGKSNTLGTAMDLSGPDSEAPEASQGNGIVPGREGNDGCFGAAIPLLTSSMLHDSIRSSMGADHLELIGGSMRRDARAVQDLYDAASQQGSGYFADKNGDRPAQVHHFDLAFSPIKQALGDYVDGAEVQGAEPGHEIAKHPLTVSEILQSADAYKGSVATKHYESAVVRAGVASSFRGMRSGLGIGAVYGTIGALTAAAVMRLGMVNVNPTAAAAVEQAAEVCDSCQGDRHVSVQDRVEGDSIDGHKSIERAAQALVGHALADKPLSKQSSNSSGLDEVASHRSNATVGGVHKSSSRPPSQTQSPVSSHSPAQSRAEKRGSSQDTSVLTPMHLASPASERSPSAAETFHIAAAEAAVTAAEHGGNVSPAVVRSQAEHRPAEMHVNDCSPPSAAAATVPVPAPVSPAAKLPEEIREAGSPQPEAEKQGSAQAMTLVVSSGEGSGKKGNSKRKSAKGKSNGSK
jgi:hypothetical protein